MPRVPHHVENVRQTDQQDGKLAGPGQSRERAGGTGGRGRRRYREPDGSKCDVLRVGQEAESEADDGGGGQGNLAVPSGRSSNIGFNVQREMWAGWRRLQSY